MSRLTLLAGSGLAAVVGIERAMSTSPDWLRMTALVATTFAWMKLLVVVRVGARLEPSQWLAYLCWFGMLPARFTRRRARAVGSPRTVLGHALVALALGTGLIVAARTGAASWTGWLTDAVALVGCSAVLHFGVIRLVEAILLGVGYPVAQLFDAPWRATSLGEFWSRRWNRGFVEMTAVLVHRPLRSCAPRFARFAGFLFSGLLHELAISVPVRAGFGGPLGYFVLHGVLLEVEAHTGLRSRLWTFVALLLPIPLLFHSPFREGVLGPLLAG